MTSEEFIAVANLLPEVCLLVTADAQILAANRAANTAGLAAPEELPGRSLLEFAVTPADDLRNYLQACAGGRGMQAGALRLTISGRERSFHCQGTQITPSLDQGPAAIFLRLTECEESITDATGRRKAEEDRARLAAIVDSSDDAIISKSLEGLITSWNRGAERIFGYTAQEAIGRPIRMLAAPDRPHEMAEILNRIRRGERIEHFETVRRRRDGSEIHVSLSVSPIQNERGEIIGASKIARDMTSRFEADVERERLLASERAARAEAEQANRMKDEFLATVSHEIRTPLNAILGWSQLLRTGKLDASELEEGLGVIERNSRAQAQLIDDLLDMSRIMTGKVRLDVRPVNLRAIVDSAVAAVRPAADAKDIEIDVAFEPGVPALMGDGTRLQQVVWNLLSNAIKFTANEGRVRVRVARTGLCIELVVSDSGQGIAPEFLPHVFERFRQADSSSRREHGGLGLGLAIVKQLVELHGGTIAAESAGVGRGATFRALLPIGARGGGAGISRPAEDRPVAPEFLEGLKVLIADDDPDSRQLVARILKSCGIVVVEASSAAAALELLTRERPDVLLSDIGMPQQDGYDLIRQVRALSREAGGNTPAAALTAFARSEDRTRALLAGFQSHVAKPIEASELIAVVGALAGRAGRH